MNIDKKLAEDLIAQCEEGLSDEFRNRNTCPKRTYCRIALLAPEYCVGNKRDCQYEGRITDGRL